MTPLLIESFSEKTEKERTLVNVPRYSQTPSRVSSQTNELIVFHSFPCFYIKELSYWGLGLTLAILLLEEPTCLFLIICISKKKIFFKVQIAPGNKAGIRKHLMNKQMYFLDSF